MSFVFASAPLLEEKCEEFPQYVSKKYTSRTILREKSVRTLIPSENIYAHASANAYYAREITTEVVTSVPAIGCYDDITVSWKSQRWTCISEGQTLP